MNDIVTGRLSLDIVPTESKDAVISCLAKYIKNATHDQLLAKISKLPLVLSSNIPQQKSVLIIQELASLGATASFAQQLTQPAAPSAKPPETPIKPNITTEKQPTLREVVLDRAFSGERIRFHVSSAYQAGLFVVAFAMVLLPLIYLGIVGSTGYLVYWYAINEVSIFSSHRSLQISLFLYVTPLVAGILLVVFMLKPLFAKNDEYQKDLEIRRGEEPLLFAFVEKLCKMIGAPMPNRICLNNEVNASAALDGGLLGVFKNDLMLTIGLPLAGGLNIQQFAGVLAHEFGHFAQTSGMRLTYLIRTINYWFARVVYEEDDWDYQLRRWSKQLDFRLGIILYISRFFIWLTKKILYFLMITGNAISCYMMRQMEFDADRYESAMAGADVFEATSNKISLLALSHSWAFQDLAESWKDGRLPNNLTELVLVNHGQMKTETIESFLKKTNSAQTGKFDTHPSASARINAARAITTSPLFSWPQNSPDFASANPTQDALVGDVPPASILMNKFDALTEKTTLDYYRKALGKTPDRKNLVDVSALVSKQEQEQSKYGALDRYFLGCYNPWMELGLTQTQSFKAPADPDSSLDKLRILRESLQKNNQKIQDTLKAYKTLGERITLTAQARVLIEAGFKINPKDFSLPGGDIKSVEASEQRNEVRQQVITADFKEFGGLYRERLSLALQLLQVPEIFSKLENGDYFKEGLDKFWSALCAMDRQIPLLDKLNLGMARLGILTHQLSDNEDDQDLTNSIRLLMNELWDNIDSLARSQANVMYPFDHADQEMTLDHFIVGDTPEHGNLGHILGSAESAVNNMLKLIVRSVAHLTHVAEEVEKAAGFQPLNNSVAH